MTRHHITKSDGPRGVRWHARVHLGTDPVTGKKIQKRISGPTRKAVEAEITRLLERQRDGLPVQDSPMALAAFLDQWLETVAPTVKPSTLRTWRSRCDAWIVPVLGTRRLKDLGPADVDRLISRVLAAGRSPSHANVIHATLRTALSSAVKWRLISRNPCSAITPPRTAAPEMRAWTAAEARTAIAAAAPDRQYGALIRLALTTGMRMGELLGLRWQDVDLERGTLAVRQTVVRGVKGKPTIGTPKTAKSRRTIAISADDVTALKRHRAWQAETRLAASSWGSGDLVFPDRQGEPLHPNSLARVFSRMIEQTGLPRIRFHDLRHSHISIMLQAGVPMKVIQERAGHATLAMTMDRYGHLSPEMHAGAAETMDRLLDQAAND